MSLFRMERAKPGLGCTHKTLFLTRESTCNEPEVAFYTVPADQYAA